METGAEAVMTADKDSCTHVVWCEINPHPYKATERKCNQTRSYFVNAFSQHVADEVLCSTAALLCHLQV